MPGLAVPSVVQPSEVRRFVGELDRRLERLDRAILIADWNLESGRSPGGSGPWQLRRSRLLSEPCLLEWVRRARERPWPAPLARRLELLERITLDAQVEQSPEVVALRSEMHRAIVEFRPLWRGRRVNRAEVRRVMRTDPDPRHRRAAYYALEPLYRPLEARLRRLVELRNDGARAAGFRSFAEMRLGFQRVSSARVVEIAEEVTARAPECSRRLREHLSPAERAHGWHRWDYGYAQQMQASLPDRSFPVRGMLPRILDAVRQWGFRTDRMHFRVAYHDLPAGGLTLAPDPPDDVRILVHPRGGWEAYMVMFHEVGHAIHSASIRSPRHLLRWHENVPGFGAFHEGIGGLFEEVSLSPDWLAAQPGVSREQAERFTAARADQDVFNAAWLATFILPELRLYERPESDPMPEAARLERRLFGFERSEPLSFVDSFYVADPVYSANYLLALLFHHQLAANLTSRFGEPLWPNRRVGPSLSREWFAPGSMVEWLPWIRELTGRPFGARAFLERTGG